MSYQLNVKYLLFLITFRTLIIIGFVGVIIATIYEVICVKLKTTPNEMTAAMSLYSNGKYLFTMRQKKDHIQSLYGLRALALIWLMLGYRFVIPLIVPLINPLDFVFDVSHCGGRQALSYHKSIA